MESYLFYIGKAALAAGAFYLAFLALFQNRKQFVFNRIYLPVSLALSFIIPLITFTTIKYIEAPVVDATSFAFLSEGAIATETFSESYSLWPHYLFGLYLLGIAGFLLFLLTGHFNAIRMVRKSRVKNLFGSRVHVTEKDIHPFSFFNKIVLSEKTLKSPNLEMIVAHESIHVKEKHTLDILFTELLFLLQWFNPFVWLIKDAVKNNLEYKTDDEIVKTNDPQSYQLAMVALAGKKGVAPFLTALNGSQLKNRIIMMKKKTGNRFALLKQLVLLPMLATLIMGLAEREVKMEFIQEKVENIINEAQKLDFSKLKIVVDGIEIPPDSPELKDIKITKENNFNSRYIIDIIEALNIDLEDIKASRSSSNPNNPFVYIRTKNYVSGTNSEFEKQTDAAPEHLKKIFPDKTLQSSASISNSATTNEPLYVVDGKITKEINQIPPQDIESISVLKDQSAIALYGNKGKNGVILITTKSKSYDYLNENAQNVRPVPKEEIKELDEMPEFPGGETALKQYIASNTIYPETEKESGIHGRAYVTFKITKEGKVTDARIARGLHPPMDKEAVRVVSSMPDWKTGKKDGKPVDTNYTVPVEFILKDAPVKVSRVTSTITAAKPLYIIDGEEFQGSLDDINPDDIKSIDVLKGESGTKHFGEKGKNGVILIQTKSGSKPGTGNVNQNSGNTKNPANNNTPNTQSNLVKEIMLPEEMPEFPGGTEALKQYIARSINYPESAKENGIQGRVYVTFKISKEGKVTDAKVARGIFPALDKEAVRVVSSLPNWNPGKQNGQPVEVVGYGIPVDFELKDYTPKVQSVASNLIIPGTLYIVDGKETTSIKDIPPDDIERINVLNKASSAAIYGQKGKDGVIIIQTKDGASKSLQGKIDNSKLGSSQNSRNKRLKSPPGSATPIFILDGKEVPDIDDVSPENIEKIDVLKGESATQLYGEKGKNGVIVMTSKQKAETNTITSELELRQFIAWNIKYPVEAQEANKTGIVQLFIELNNSGQVEKISEKASGDELILDEVVVVAYKNEDADIVGNSPISNNDLLKNEAKRVFNLLQKVEIPQFKGKTVGVTVKFMLQ